MKSILKLGALALAFVLVGAGCADTLSLNNCVHTTSWGSCVNEQYSDSALLGTWTLTAQQVVTPTGTVENPFNGRLLTFTESGSFNSYAEDWSPEVVTSSTTTCTTEGTNGGSWAAVPMVDDTGNTVMELRIVPSGIAGDILVTCDDGGIIEVTSSAASTPLGVGPTTDAATGNLLDTPAALSAAVSAGADIYVSYSYSISEDGSILVITQQNPLAHSGVPSPTPSGVTNVYFFTR